MVLSPLFITYLSLFDLFHFQYLLYPDWSVWYFLLAALSWLVSLIAIITALVWLVSLIFPFIPALPSLVSLISIITCLSVIGQFDFLSGLPMSDLSVLFPASWLVRICCLHVWSCVWSLAAGLAGSLQFLLPASSTQLTASCCHKPSHWQVGCKVFSHTLDTILIQLATYRCTCFSTTNFMTVSSEVGVTGGTTCCNRSVCSLNPAERKKWRRFYTGRDIL